MVAVPVDPLPDVVNVTNVEPSKEPSNVPVVVLYLMTPAVFVDLCAVVPEGRINPSVWSIFLIWLTPLTPVYLPPDMYTDLPENDMPLGKFEPMK